MYIFREIHMCISTWAARETSARQPASDAPRRDGFLVDANHLANGALVDVQ